VATDRLTQRELAERWQVSEACLERWRTEGRGPVYMKLIGRVVYRLEDIEAFERESLRSSTSMPAPAAAGGVQ
jgi:predicted site-specific integrase-resolvase